MANAKATWALSLREARTQQSADGGGVELQTLRVTALRTVGVLVSICGAGKVSGTVWGELREELSVEVCSSTGSPAVVGAAAQPCGAYLDAKPVERLDEGDGSSP